MKSSKITLSIVILFFIFSIDIFAQTKYTGYYYDGGYSDYTTFKYTREYQQQGENFVTVYKIFDPRAGYYLDITVTHYKAEKKIVISIDDITVRKEFGHISIQEFIYENPSLGFFGLENPLHTLGFDEQNKLPKNLLLKFVSGKFESVKVAHIVRGKENLDAMKWYVLDEK